MNHNHDAGIHSDLSSEHLPHSSKQQIPFSVLGLSLSGYSRNPPSYIDATLALRPSPTISKKLCQAYLERVDPIVRVLHRPSPTDFLLEGKSYFDYHDTDPILDVLRSAVFFIAMSP